MSKQSVRWREVGGAFILCAGVALLSLSRSTKPIGLSFGSFSHWYAAAIIAGIAFVAVHTGHRRRGTGRATLPRLGAGPVLRTHDAPGREALGVLQNEPGTGPGTSSA